MLEYFLCETKVSHSWHELHHVDIASICSGLIYLELSLEAKVEEEEEISWE